MSKRYVFQHRRGTTSQWEQTEEELLDGEIGIEYSNDRTTARLLIGNKEGMAAFPFFPISRIITLSLPAANWTGDYSPFSQVFELGTINGVTSHSKLDLQPTEDLLLYLQDNEISLVTKNDGGVVTVYALNYKPEDDISVQATITEVIEE